MAKIRFRDVKKAILEDFKKTHEEKWHKEFICPFIADIKVCKCNEDIISVLMQNGFTYAEALEQIISLITTV